MTYETLRVIEFCLGLLLFCTALFLYEDENGKIQSTLEAWWVRLDDAQGPALSRQAAFMRGVARLTTEVFDKLFGKRLISLRAVGTSTCLSIGSILLAGTVLATVESDVSYMMWFPILGVIVIGLGLAPLKLVKPKALYLWYAVVAVTLFSFLLSLGVSVAGLIPASLLLAPSLASDICFVWITRRMLAWVAKKSSFLPMLAVILLNLFTAGLLLVAGPTIALVVLPESWSNGIIAIGWLLAILNGIDALVAMLFVVMALVMILHRLFWPILKRFVYALQGLGIAKRRKLNATVGIALMAASTGKSLELLKAIAGIFTG